MTFAEMKASSVKGMNPVAIIVINSWKGIKPATSGPQTKLLRLCFPTEWVSNLIGGEG